MNQYPIMRRLRLFNLLLIIVCLNSHANELMGQLDGFTYTAKDQVFITKLPTLDGEIRDFPNAVSVYSAITGSQDSLEHYAVPAEEQTKYKQQGADSYHAEFIRAALIGKRYQGTFKQVKIIEEHSETVADQELYILALALPGGSQVTDGQGKRKDLLVSIATLMKGEKIYVYQVAVTNLGQTQNELVEKNANKILEWIKNTRFNG